MRNKPTSKKIAPLARLILNSNGRFFTCTFVKKNGEVRTMTARLGVKKGLVKPAGVRNNVWQQALEGHITVYEPAVQGYRNINPDTILSVSVDGVVAVKK